MTSDSERIDMAVVAHQTKDSTEVNVASMLREIAAAYENAPLIMMVVDGDRRLRQPNRTALEFFGATQSQVVGLRPGNAMRCLSALSAEGGCGTGPHCEQCIVRKTVVNTLETGNHHRSVEAGLEIATPDGPVSLTVLLSSTPIEIGGETMALVTALDISGRIAAEKAILDLNEQLEEQVRVRTAEFSSAVKELDALSHSMVSDVGTPVRAVSTYAQILLDEYRDQLDEEGRHYLHQLCNATYQMEELFEALLGMTSISRSELQIVEVDLSKIATAIADELYESEPTRTINIKVQPNMKVRADTAMLRSLMRSLLSNAWKFTSKQKDAVVEIGECEVDGKRAFFVKDNGAGFNMAYASKMFSPFRRFHPSKEFPGIGMGLASAARIVSKHGGTIRAKSEVGKGATFVFTLG